jgi:copper chaperone CopZ
VRSDLKAVEGISEVETDLDEQTCCFKVARSVNVKTLLDGLAEKNNKISDWSLVK